MSGLNPGESGKARNTPQASVWRIKHQLVGFGEQSCYLGGAAGAGAGADVGSVTVTFFPLPFLGCFGGMIT